MNTNRYIIPIPFLGYDGEGDGDGGDKGPDLDHPSVKKAIEAAVAAATDGLRSKNDELLGEVKSFKTKLEAFDGLDAKKVREQLAALEKDDELAMLKDGRLDELVAKRVEKVKLESDEALAKVQEELTQLREERDSAKKTLTRKTVDDALRDEAVRAKVSTEAIEDVLLRAAGVFSVGDDGEIEARDASGQLVRIKVGTDGGERILTPALFIEQLKTTAPHYWANGRGSGSRGSGGSGVEPRSDVSALAAVAGDPKKFKEMRQKKSA